MAIISMGALASILAPIAAKAGATALSTVLRSTNTKAGAVAADVIGTLAGKLGVPATPDAVQAKVQANPAAVEQALRETQTEKMDALAKVIAAENDEYRIYAGIIAGERGSGSLLQRIWRPLAGLIFSGACAAVVITTCLVVLRQSTVDPSLASLLALCGTTITTLAAFCGYYAGQRTKEKTAGVQ